MDPTVQLVATIAGPALAFAAAWGGVKVSLNGTRESVRRIEKKLDAIDERVDGHAIVLSTIQTRCALMHPPQAGAPESYPWSPPKT